MDFYVKSDIKNGIQEIEFYNEKANSFNSSMLADLTEIINKSASDNAIRAIILKGKGEKVFSAGASFDEMLWIEDFTQAKNFFLGFAKLISAMLQSPKFIVTAIYGKTIGGSVGITAASDYVVATSTAQFRLSEYSVGIGPFVIAPVIERKIGLSPLMEMTIETEYKDVNWALKKGLVNYICDSPQETLNYAKDLASKIAARNPLAMKELKNMFWEKADVDFSVMEKRAEKSANLLLNEYTKNFLYKFKSK